MVLLTLKEIPRPALSPPHPPSPVAQFDPNTGKPLGQPAPQQARFDPATGQPIGVVPSAPTFNPATGQPVMAAPVQPMAAAPSQAMDPALFQQQMMMQQQMSMQQQMMRQKNGGGGGQPIIINNSQQQQQMMAPPQQVIMRQAVTEAYCGPSSWCIGLFIFPCICFWCVHRALHNFPPPQPCGRSKHV